MKSKQLTVSRNTYQLAGKWVKKPSRTQVVNCECGNKYIKTRDNQKACLKCVYK
jgi:hypothetical protein